MCSCVKNHQNPRVHLYIIKCARSILYSLWPTGSLNGQRWYICDARMMFDGRDTFGNVRSDDFRARDKTREICKNLYNTRRGDRVGNDATGYVDGVLPRAIYVKLRVWPTRRLDGVCCVWQNVLVSQPSSD